WWRLRVYGCRRPVACQPLHVVCLFGGQVGVMRAGFYVHRPSPGLIGGHGSARGSAGALILPATLAACLAAAATSSGNSANALSGPARRASAPINSLSIAPLLPSPSPVLPHRSPRPGPRAVRS